MHEFFTIVRQLIAELQNLILPIAGLIGAWKYLKWKLTH